MLSKCIMHVGIYIQFYDLIFIIFSIVVGRNYSIKFNIRRTTRTKVPVYRIVQGTKTTYGTEAHGVGVKCKSVAVVRKTVQDVRDIHCELTAGVQFLDHCYTQNIIVHRIHLYI